MAVEAGVEGVGLAGGFWGLDGFFGGGGGPADVLWARAAIIILRSSCSRRCRFTRCVLLSGCGDRGSSLYVVDV